MSLGTLDRTPPPFFRQGPSALTKVLFCSVLAVFLMVADTRFRLTQPLRAAVATVLHYPQRALLVPVDALAAGRTYLLGLESARAAEAEAQRALVRQAERSARVEQLTTENERLRALLDLRPGLNVHSQAAEVLYEAPDPFSRKVVVDRGAAHGIALGAPVINEAGVLGQVTRVYPLSSEVTLLTDKDAAIPVLNTRTQSRHVAFGLGGNNGLEMRFIAGNADVQVGDTLLTSGLDGVYPPGLAVARVAALDRKADSSFAKIQLTPAAAPDGVRHVLLLEPIGLQLPPRPEPTAEEAAAAAAASAPRRGGRR